MPETRAGERDRMRPVIHAMCLQHASSKRRSHANSSISPRKLPAKLPQQTPQDQDDLEQDRPSNLSAPIGQLCAWLLEHPPLRLGRQLPTLALDFVRFLQRSRALRLPATMHPALSDRFFGFPKITHALAAGEKRSSPLCLRSFIHVRMFQFLGC
jgi:hypothetical protein